MLGLALVAVVGVLLVAAQPGDEAERRTPALVGAVADLDVVYDDASPRNRLDVYTPSSGDGPFPTVVYLHPGGWVAGDKSGSMPVWDWTERGYAVVSANYRYARPPGTIADAVDDAEAAVRFVVDHGGDWNLDVERVGVFGFSAGGHLAAMLTFRQLPVAVVAVAGAPTDLVALLEPDVAFFDGLSGSAVAESIAERLGCASVEACQDEAGAVSPARLSGPAGSMPILIVHGSADPIVSVDQAQALYDHLRAWHADVELVVVDGAGHDPLVDHGVPRAVRPAPPPVSTPRRSRECGGAR